MGLAAAENNQKIRITIRYIAIFDDPAPIRPLNADNPGYGVSATISERGSFLLAGSGWYPQWAGGHSIYTLKVIGNMIGGVLVRSLKRSEHTADILVAIVPI